MQNMIPISRQRKLQELDQIEIQASSVTRSNILTGRHSFSEVKSEGTRFPPNDRHVSIPESKVLIAVSCAACRSVTAEKVPSLIELRTAKDNEDGIDIDLEPLD